MKRREIAAALGAASLIALMMSVGGAASAPAELTIGVLPELTGPLSDGGPAFEQASRLAVATANDAAKAAGLTMTIKIAIADPQGDPQAALSAARTVVDKGASCILGPSTTPESIAILNGLTMQRKITLWPTASSMRLRTVKDDGTIFRTVPADALQTQALMAAMIDALGSASGKTLAIAYRNEPYGEGLAKSVGQAWQAAGGKIQGPIGFDPQQASFDSEAGQLVSGSPDAYFVVDYPETYAKFGAALLRTGKLDAKKLFLPDAMSMSSVPANIPQASLEGARGVVAGSPKGSEAFEAFTRLWTKQGGVENAAFTTNAFDAGIMCFLASVAADSADPGAIRDKVREIVTDGAPKFTFETLPAAIKALQAGQKIDYVGASGEMRFAANGDPVAGIYDVFAFEGGKRVNVKQVVAK
jgi:branched-chain amino acid transport system substrate-binding protein